jgi:HSP20 family protein
MRMLGPFTRAGGLTEEVDRLLDRFFDFRVDVPMRAGWVPRMDVTETKDALVATFEVPGIDPGDIRVTLANGVLAISGEKKKETEEKDDRRYRSERVTGRFERSFRLPTAVDEKKVTATFKNGVLTITMAKTPEPVETTIPVKAE